MKRTLLLAALAASISANASTRDSYFGFGVALPLHASARLYGFHERSSARVGMRLVAGKHLNKWFTLEGEGFYAKIKIDGTDPGDRSAASAVGAMVNGLVRKSYGKVTLWGGVGLGLSRNFVSDYMSDAIGLALLNGTTCNRLAMQFKTGLTYAAGKRVDLSLSVSHLRLGRFSYIDSSGTNPVQAPFKTNLTAVNAIIQFKF